MTRRWTAICLSLPLLAGCEQPLSALGRTPAAARETADQFFGSLASRLTRVRRTDEFGAVQRKLTQHVLAPSRLYADTSIWNGADGPAKLLHFWGGAPVPPYRLTPRRDVTEPSYPGEARHVYHLTKLSGHEYEWRTHDEFAIGRIGAEDLALAMLSIWGAAEHRSSAETVAAFTAALPRSSAVLARLFTVDSFRTTPAAEGSTAVTVALSIHPNRVRAAGFPRFADFLAKHVSPTRHQLAVVDAAGRSYLTSAGRDGRLVLRVRTRDGAFFALDGSPSTLPDTFRLRADVSAKFGIFRVGLDRLDADVTVVRDPHERGWLFRFPRAPDWRLPLAVNHLIRAPLRRPFEQGGWSYRFTVSDREGAQSLIERRIHIVLWESALLRWLGGLSGATGLEFAEGTEGETNRFFFEAVEALRADIAGR